MSNSPLYSTFAPLQQLGEEIAAHGADGPTKRPRLKAWLAGLFAATVFAVSPAGAAVGDAIDGLIGSEPTASSLYLGDLPDGHNLSGMQDANARYCGGDVGGERGDRAAVLPRV